MSADKKAIADMLTSLLETHGSAEVLGALADACDVATAVDEDDRAAYEAASKHIREAAKHVEAAETRATDVPTTLAMGMDLLFQAIDGE